MFEVQVLKEIVEITEFRLLFTDFYKYYRFGPAVFDLTSFTYYKNKTKKNYLLRRLYCLINNYFLL